MLFKKLPDGDNIPTLGLGTWEVGGRMSPDYTQDGEIVKAFRAALEMGYTHIDTAEMYGGGHTEELVGRAIRNLDRQKLFLASKAWSTHMGEKEVAQALEGSLKRLGTDYLDLYLIHWPNEQVPLQDTFRGLNRLVAQGKARRVGVCNFDLGQLKRARELCETPLAGDQVPYSLFNRRYAKNGVLDYCQQNGLVLTAYTPIEKGRIAGRRELQEIASRYGATPIQVALNWLARQPQVITIPMSTNRQHLQENLESLELELSEEDLQRLDRLG